MKISKSLYREPNPNGLPNAKAFYQRKSAAPDNVGTQVSETQFELIFSQMSIRNFEKSVWYHKSKKNSTSEILSSISYSQE